MTKEIIIIVLILVIVYLYYQIKFHSNAISEHASEIKAIDENSIQIIQEFTSFLQTNLNSNNLEELKTKLGSKTLDELLEENEDYETEVDTLTRTKNSLEQDLLAQSNAFQNRLREKDRELKKLKEDLKELEKVREKLTSEKQQHKGSLERISQLTEQITNLEKKMPGEFPKEDLTKTHQEQLRKIYSLFDLRARGMKEIDFNQLMSVLQGVKNKVDKK